jgi:hypothetical protein
MNRSQSWVGWAAVAIGIATMVASFLVTSTTAGAGLTLGFGALTGYFGALSVLARNPTPDHWGLVVVGLATFMVPWIGEGFAPDRGAAWTGWIAGFLVLALGMRAWTHDNPPTESGINEYGAPARGVAGAWVGRLALAVGLGAVIAAAVLHSSPTAAIVTIGLGGLTAVLALWSLLATDPTGDHLKIATAGFVLFLAPWVVNFAGENVAWAAWVAGFAITTLGVGGYLRGESLDHSRIVRQDAAASYQQRFRRTDPPR